MTQDTPTAVRCLKCKRDAALLDQHSHCERCATDRQHLAWALDDLDVAVADVLERGLEPDQVQHAVKLAVSDRAGGLPSEGLVRRGVDTRERFIWQSAYSSLFYEDDERPAKMNPLHSLRTYGGDWTLEELAAELGVAPTTVALWEQEQARIPGEMVERLADMFGVQPHYLTGEEG